MQKKKAKWLSVEALQIAVKRRGAKSKRRKRNAKKQNGCLWRPYKYLRNEEKWKVMEKRKDIPIWMQSSKEEQEELRKSSSVINAKK